MKPLLITLFVLGLLFLFAAYRVSSFFYFKKHQSKYHFYQMFPYEFNYPLVFKGNIYGNILFIIALGFLSAFYIVFSNSTFATNSVTTITMVIFIIIVSTAFLALLLMPLNYLRTHAIVAILSLTIATVLPLLIVFYIYQSIQNHQKFNEPYYMDVISIVLAGLMAVFMLVVLLNPKATFKIYMDKALDSEGKEMFIRPRIIYMAFNEWIAIFTTFLSPLPLVILILLL